MRAFTQMLDHSQTPKMGSRALFLCVFFDALLIVLASTILLPQNLNWLFSNSDAELYYSLDFVGREFGGRFMFSNINPVAGLGTLMSQLNPLLHPIHYLWYSSNNLVVPYIFLALLLYLATFSLGRTLGYPAFACRIAGYIVAVFWVPFFGPFSVDIMARIAPWTTYIVCVQLVAWSLFVLVGTRKRLLYDLFLCVFFAGTLVYAFLIEFSYAALSMPFSVLFFGAVLLSSKSKRELVLKLVALITFLLCFVALDLGQVLSTATQISTRMADYVTHDIPVGSRSFLSSLLGNIFYSLTPVTLQAVPYLKALSLVGIAFGGFIFVFGRRLLSRRIYCVILASAVGFFGLHLVSREYMVSNVTWPWPAPVYFEWIAHPIYALSGVTAVYFLGTLGFYGLSNCFPNALRPAWLSKFRKIAAGADRGDANKLTAIQWSRAREIAFVAFVVCVILISNKVLPFDHKNTTIFDVAGVVPPAWAKDDPLTDLLANSLSLKAGQEYRGTFLSTLSDASVKRSYQMRNFIPIVTDYQRGDTLQVRAIRNLIDYPPFERHVQLLRLFGIRYVQYPQPVVGRGLELAKDLARGAGNGIGSVLFLYRVADPNLSGYTPTTIERAGNWEEFVAIVKDRDINWRTTAFLSGSARAEFDANLVAPSDLGALIVTADGLEINAASRGTSLLVLPRSFSNCYRWHPSSSGIGKAELVRVNFLQLGVLLRGDIRGRIIVDMSWRAGPKCLAQDVRDLYRLGVRKTATPEELHPKGYLGFFGSIIARKQQDSLRGMLEQP